MYIECRTCPGRGLACDECVMTALLRPLPGIWLDEDEAAAVEVFRAAGLVTEREARHAHAVREPAAAGRVAG